MKLEFKDWMYEIICNNEKIQTRRLKGLEVINNHIDGKAFFGYDEKANRFLFKNNPTAIATEGEYPIEEIDCPYGKAGDVVGNSRGMQLKITNVWVERLHSIKPGDIIKEGCVKYGPFGEYRGSLRETGSAMQYLAFKNAIDAFQSLWLDAYGVDEWKKNPFVWVIDFKMEETKEFQIKENYGNGILAWTYFEIGSFASPLEIEKKAIETTKLEWRKTRSSPLLWSVPEPPRPTIEIAEYRNGEKVKGGIRLKTKWR